jgi:hypothetical protein
MIWIAKVYDSETGRFLARLTVHAPKMREAEDAAISKTSLAMRGDPSKLIVRSMHGFKEGRLA